MIINFNEIAKPYLSRIQKQTKEETKKETQFPELNNVPYYRPVIKVPLIEGKRALVEFMEKYGQIKSAKYVETIQNKMKNIRFDEKYALELSKEKYSTEYDMFCAFMLRVGKVNKKELCKIIEFYIKTQGNYIESPQSALLIENILNENDVKAQNVCIKDSEDIEQHYFTVINMDDMANIKEPDTWGKNAVICDAWAQICMKVPEAIEYYNNLFNLEDGSFCFDYAY